jgi:cellulose biosynthesis protein BcsQ
MILPFVSMYDARRTVHRDAVSELEATRPDLLPTRIPVSALVERMAVDLAPLTVVAPRAAVTAAFRSLWADVSARLWPPAPSHGA